MSVPHQKADKTTDKKNHKMEELIGKESIIEPIIVCQDLSEENSVRTLGEAVQKSVRGGVIRVAPGVYRQNITIKVGDIKIQAMSPNTNVIIINSTHPSIILDLDHEKESVTFESLKFAHHADLSPELVQNSIDGVYMNDQINCFNIGDNLNTMVYVKRGKAIIEECKFSLNVMNPDSRSIIPCITVDKHGFLVMTRCELFGSTNSTKQTIGVLSKKGSAIIKECQFIAHQKAAVYSSGSRDTVLNLSNNKVHHCHDGIVLIGDFKASVENNTIEDCDNIGVKLGMCNRSKVSLNSISRNSIGIEFENGDPLIQNNMISFSRTVGVRCIARDMIRCDGSLKFNVIKQSKEAGIQCAGSLNYVKICNNPEIGFSGKCGILVEKGAHPFIFRNRIQKNLGQGILITEGSSAFIEKNQIASNLKANIALGGTQSINTYVVNNKISLSRCEGIFMIYAERLLCSGNQICKNYDGIIGITSIPEIDHNVVSQNQSNGILMLEKSNPKIHKNVIAGNKDAGLFLKGKSRGIVSKNEFKSNQYELIIEDPHPSLDNVHKENVFQGEVRIPQNYKCTLI